MTVPIVYNACHVLSEKLLHEFSVECFQVNPWQRLQASPVVFSALAAYSRNSIRMEPVAVGKWNAQFFNGAGEWEVCVDHELPDLDNVAAKSFSRDGALIGVLVNVSDYSHLFGGRG